VPREWRDPRRVPWSAVLVFLGALLVAGGAIWLGVSNASSGSDLWFEAAKSGLQLLAIVVLGGAVAWAFRQLDARREEGRRLDAATVLYPLAKGRIGNLIQRAYALACVQAHIWHDLPLVRVPPLSWFQALEEGRVAERPMPRGDGSAPSPVHGTRPAQ
jgi:hypothetical protein